MNNKLQTKINGGILSYEGWKCQHHFRKFGKSYSRWSVFRHTLTYIYHMRISVASHSSSLLLLTPQNGTKYYCIDTHSITHSLHGTIS